MAISFKQHQPFQKMLRQDGTVGGHAGRKSEAWGGVTDPAKHNPDSFRYLVHALPSDRPYWRRVQMQRHAEDLKMGLVRKGADEGDQSIDLQMFPERINERVAVSASLIDDKHRHTWDSAGLILEVPEERVKMTSSHDLGSSTSLEMLDWQSRIQQRLNGDQLLSESYKTGCYNEVVVLGKSGTGDPIKIAGFFAKADADGFLNEALALRVRQRAERLNLPFVVIAAPNIYGQERYEEKKDERSLQHGGKLYLLGGHNPLLNFMCIDGTRRHRSFISPSELEEILPLVEKHKHGDPDIVDLIRAEYQSAHGRHMLPEIKRNKDGIITSVYVKEGYGKEEITYRINADGYCYAVNNYQLLIRSGDDTQINDPNPWYYRRIGKFEVDKVIEEAIKRFGEGSKEAAEVRSFYEELRPRIKEPESSFLERLIRESKHTNAVVENH